MSQISWIHKKQGGRLWELNGYAELDSAYILNTLSDSVS